MLTKDQTAILYTILNFAPVYIPNQEFNVKVMCMIIQLEPDIFDPPLENGPTVLTQYFTVINGGGYTSRELSETNERARAQKMLESKIVNALTVEIKEFW